MHDEHDGHLCGPACFLEDAGATGAPSPEDRIDAFVEKSIVNAIVGGDLTRRRFVEALGAGELLSVVSQLFPLEDA